MSELLAKHLRDWLDKHYKPNLDGYLFTSSKGKPYLSDNVVKYGVCRAMKNLGIETARGVHVGIHCFRHGVTSELLESGTPIHVVTRLMRHADSLESGSPILHEDSKKPTRTDLDAWRDRILDRRAGIPRPAVPRSGKELDKAKAAIQPLLGRGIVTDEVRALAAEHVAFAYSLPNNAFSAEDEAALVQFKIDAWTGSKTADE